MTHKALWIVFFAALLFTLGLKAAQLGWFTPHPPLELDGKPALLFFNKSRGCECELFIYNNAELQMDEWDAPVQVIRIDLDLRPDLARQYDVIRAPSLILLNAESQVVWRQDEGLSDESPLDLNQAESQVEALTINPFQTRMNNAQTQTSCPQTTTRPVVTEYPYLSQYKWIEN